MKVFAVYNGYTAWSAVYVLVTAEDEERAIAVAEKAFKEDARNKTYKQDLKRAIRFRMKRPKKYRYNSSYWSGLTVEEIFSATDREQSSEIFE